MREAPATTGSRHPGRLATLGDAIALDATPRHACASRWGPRRLPATSSCHAATPVGLPHQTRQAALSTGALQTARLIAVGFTLPTLAVTPAVSAGTPANTGPIAKSRHSWRPRARTRHLMFQTDVETSGKRPGFKVFTPPRVRTSPRVIHATERRSSLGLFPL